MTNILTVERQATLVATALMCSLPLQRVSVTLPKTAPTKSLDWEHPYTTTGCIPSHIITTTIETDHSPLTTDTTTEVALTGHNNTTNPTTTKALATTRDTYHFPSNHHSSLHYPCLTDALSSNTCTRTHHTSINVTFLDNVTFPLQSLC